MPVLNRPTSPPDGPLVTVRIGITRADTLRRRRSNLAVPQPITTQALLDTGAECTCVDPAIIHQLGVGWRTIGPVGIPAAGGLTGSTGYDVGFTVVHPSGDPKFDLCCPRSRSRKSRAWPNSGWM